MRGLQIDEFLSYAPSFVFKCLAVIALLVSWVPLVGFLISIIALFGSRHFNGWPKRVSTTALILSILPMVILAVGLVSELVR